MKTTSWLCAAMAVLFAGALAAQEQLVPALDWDSTTQGKFVMSVAVDAQNNVWAGTEDNGLWRYDVRAKKWKQFTAKDDGLGDDSVYALAVDKLGRVWAGHLNHGVSVWNGEKWKNYGLLDGPLGDRVFAIATCPTDGDVWIATDCGVARYSIAKDDWDYFTRASGLPSNQIQSIAFKSNGDIFLGTQCDGVASATAADGYKKWKTLAGPTQMPNAPVGEGLPGNLINDMTMAATGEKDPPELLMIATTTGVGLTPDGKTAMFGRGADWEANVNGLYVVPTAPGKTPKDVPPLLAEDWVTAVRQEKKTGNIWFGYRTKGIEVRSPGTNKIVTQAGQDADATFVRAICLPEKGPPLIAVVDIDAGGLKTLASAKDALEPGADAPKEAPALPSPAKPADAATFAALVKQTAIFKNPLKTGDGMYLADDWRTQGDWTGRYGSGIAMLCGFDSDSTFHGSPGYDVVVSLGPHVKGDTEPQSHVEKKATDNPHVLYNPILGRRSEAEYNDQSCTLAKYPMDWEGPDLWVETTVPEGVHCVSLYFTNNDLHDPGNGVDALRKCRDYNVDLLAWAQDKDVVQKSVPIASARVTDFWGGVYKQFAVAGPGKFVIRVGRNHSFGAKLQGVFIDRLSGQDTGDKKLLPGFDDAPFAPGDLADTAPIDNDPVLSGADKLWTALDDNFDKRGLLGLQIPLRIYAYRAAAAGKAPAELLEVWRWQIGLWAEGDREKFQKAMKAAFDAYSKKKQ